MKVESRTDDVLRTLEQAKARALEIIGGKAETYAKRLCPVKTSNLRNSIDHARKGSSTIVIGSDVKYAPFVELGHHQEVGRYVPVLGKRLKQEFVAGKPFLRPALENHLEEYKEIMRKELSKTT